MPWQTTGTAGHWQLALGAVPWQVRPVAHGPAPTTARQPFESMSQVARSPLARQAPPVEPPHSAGALVQEQVAIPGVPEHGLADAQGVVRVTARQPSPAVKPQVSTAWSDWQ